MKILMVCLGNICRSPLAQGILEFKIKEKGLSWTVDSAGTSGFHRGEAPDKRSVKTAKNHQIDISNQRSRIFNPYDFEVFDVIYVMDRNNYRDLITWAQNDEERNKVKLIMSEVSADEFVDVPDPYYNSNGFEEVYEMLNAACEQIVLRYT